MMDANNESEHNNSKKSENKFAWRVVGEIFIVVVIIICIVFVIKDCNKEANPNDGRCDICGAKSTIVYNGHEMCTKCYIAMEENWSKKQYGNSDYDNQTVDLFGKLLPLKNYYYRELEYVRECNNVIVAI